MLTCTGVHIEILWEPPPRRHYYTLLRVYPHDGSNKFTQVVYNEHVFYIWLNFDKKCLSIYFKFIRYISKSTLSLWSVLYSYLECLMSLAACLWNQNYQKRVCYAETMCLVWKFFSETRAVQRLGLEWRYPFQQLVLPARFCSSVADSFIN